MTKMIFVSLPVGKLAASKRFYEAVGFTNNPQFTDDTAACMVLSDVIHVMLLTHDKYRQFTTKAIADARTTSEVLICISADSRADVDGIVGKAKAVGTVSLGGPRLPQAQCADQLRSRGSSERRIS